MVNIVLLVRDRYKLTEQTIRTLYENTDPDSFNLTIVDDESEDFRVQRLLDIDKRGTFHFLNRHNTSVVAVNNSSHVLSKLKNLGVYWSEQRFGRGDWLYLSDNDVYFKPGWLDTMIDRATYSEPLGFRLWGGQAHPFHQPIPTKENLEDVENGEGLTEHDCLAGTSWLMRWETWDRYGPFATGNAPGVCQSEDYAFTEKMRNSSLLRKFRELDREPHPRIGVVNPHVVIDCGITNSDGKPSPGSDLKLIHRIPGVYYE